MGIRREGYPDKNKLKNRLKFGKYKNIPIRSIPIDYLKWLTTIDYFPKIPKNIRELINKRISS